MVLGVVAVVEEQPVVNFAVAAHAPRDRFVRVAAVMPVIAVQETEAVAEVPKWNEEKNHVTPVEAEQDKKRGCERGQLDPAPSHVAVVAFAQFLSDQADIIAEKTEEDVAPGIFGFALVTVPINGDPVHRFALFVWPVGIAFVMLHVNAVIVSLGKTTGDRLANAKQAVQQGRAEKRVVNKIVADAIDIGVDHQRVDQPQNQHHPQRRAREKQEECEKIGEMKKTRQRWHRVPARVREEL